MSILIRAMTINDLAAVETIQADAYSGYFLESAEIIAQRFQLSPTTAWVAEHDGNVCAYLVAYWSRVGKINPLNAPFNRIENPDCLYLHDLALLASAQGLGIAKRLITTAIDHAQQNAAQALALLSVQNSKQFWLACGFSEYAGLEAIQQANLNTYINVEGINAEDINVESSAFYMVKEI